MYRYLLGTVLFGLTVAVGMETHADEKEKRPPKAPGGPPFLKDTAKEFIKRFDKNQDGTLSRDELPPRLAGQFEQLDQNKDGKLDESEVERMLQMIRKRFSERKGKGEPGKRPGQGIIVERILERLDTNKDGKISREEARGPLEKMFDLLDTNKDGYLDKDELRRFAERMALQKGAGPGAKAGPGAEKPRPMREAADFDALDKDADGRLTKEELRGTAFEKQFEAIDTNKDGKIDRKEFEAFLSRREKK